MNDGNLSAQLTVLATPELVGLLSLYLTPVDLSHCVQVSTCWNQAFVPKVWHTVDDKKMVVFDQGVSKTERNEIMDAIRTRFNKYGHHIRVLRAQWDIVIEAASVSCIHLTSLHLQPSQACKLNEPETWAACPGAIEAAEEARNRVAIADAKEKARRPAALEAFCAAKITAAETPEEAERLSNLFSDQEGRDKALASREDSISFMFFLPTFTINTPESQTKREIKTLPGDLGVLHVGFPPTTERSELEWMLLQDSWRLVAANPGLQKLRMEGMPAFQEREDARPFVHGVLASLKDLRELSLPSAFMDSADFWSMDQFAPKIESLEVHSDCIRWMSNNDPRQQGTNPSSEKIIRGLKTLTLDFYGPRDVRNCNRGLVDVACFPHFLLRLPDLESFTLKVAPPRFSTKDTPGASMEQMPLTEQQIEAIGLKRFYFRGASSQLGSLLQYLPNLIELHSAGEGVTAEIVDAMVSHCKKIEVVSQLHEPWHISDMTMRRRPPNGVNNLLVHLPTLKILNLIESYIQVEELVQRPWTCLGLEKLRCRIVGVERLNESQEEVYSRISAPGYTVDLTEEESAVLEQFHRYRKQQDGVYDRLAKLTKLKVLDVGYESRYPWAYKGDNWYDVDGVRCLRYGGPVPDTMEFSLESGLDRLSVLGNLEMFGFEGNNHRIGEKELDWMVEKWPKLNLMYGLAEDRLMAIEHDQEKAALREYMQQLKPEVVHDSLFQDII